MRTTRIGPDEKVKGSSRYFDTLDDVFGWAEHAETMAKQRMEAITKTLIKGGVDMKNAGGKNAVERDKAFENGKRYAYEDMARAIQEISPERRLLKDALDPDQVCVTCGSDLPRPMIPAPPPTCSYVLRSGLLTGGEVEPLTCDSQAFYKLSVNTQDVKAEQFCCKDHFFAMMTELGGYAKVEILR